MTTASASPGLLIVSPCDPGSCGIYFGVQRRALSSAVALARATGRRLVLPPVEWYDGQAQEFANAFHATAQGRTPLYARWSDLYDIDALRQGGIDVIEYHEARIDHIDRAVLQTGNAANARRGQSETEAKDQDLLRGHLTERGCKQGRAGLQANFSFGTSDLGGMAVATDGGELWGRHVSIGALRCGVLDLQHLDAVKALGQWLGDAPVGALFDVGHHIHTVFRDGVSHGLLQHHLRPSAALEREALRFIEAELRESRPTAAGAAAKVAGSLTSRYVAVHWRHGDYVAYRTLSPLESVVKRVRAALEEIGCASCPIFLMTNCRNVSALAEIRAALPTLVRYSPPAGQPHLAEEGPRLLVEQAIAMRATSFVSNPRSAVSQFVDMVRSSRRPTRPRSAAHEAQLEHRLKIVRDLPRVLKRRAEAKAEL